MLLQIYPAPYILLIWIKTILYSIFSQFAVMSNYNSVSFYLFRVKRHQKRGEPVAAILQNPRLSIRSLFSLTFVFESLKLIINIIPDWPWVTMFTLRIHQASATIFLFCIKRVSSTSYKLISLTSLSVLSKHCFHLENTT